jgi:phosphoribosylanthranilate isomerase
MVAVKMCGFTRLEDAKLACDLGVDMVGVLVDLTVTSPREVGLPRARSILSTVPPNVETVVVSMPQDVEEARRLDGKIGSDFLQVHSFLEISEIEQIKETIAKKLIVVVSIGREEEGSEDSIAKVEKLSDVVDFLLLDTSSPSGGGTGRVHDWETSREIVDFFDGNVVLAGGLDPTNVGEAIEKVEPYGVDVASGVETIPGRKDPDLMEKFMEKSRC